MKRAIFGLLALAAATSAAAQSTPYYITDGDNRIGYIIQSGVLQSTFTVFEQNNVIAYAFRFDRGKFLVAARDGSSSEEYSAAGVRTGVANNLGAQRLDELLDGGTDGTHTYVARCCAVSGNGIYKGNLNFGNQTLLIPGESFGVTYGGGFVWALMDFSGLSQFTAAGQFVNSFALPYANTAALAYEQSTNSLWFGINGSGDIYNYSLAGQELAHLSITGLEGNYYGGEMLNSMSVSVVPEPSTYALMSAGLLAVALVRRRRQRES